MRQTCQPASLAVTSHPRAIGWSLVLALVVPGSGSCQSYDANLSARLDGFIEAAFELDITPGMAVAVVRGDQVVYLRGFGYADAETRRPVTPETVFYIASSTKSFTGLATAILHERGKLDMDAPLTRYLPEVELHKGLDPNEITLRDLLTHTHGIRGRGPVDFRSAYSGDHTHQLLVDLLRHQVPAENGRAFEYGNIGYNTASLAMDAELGMSWKDVLEREIFAPLGMSSTTAYVSRVPEDRLAMPYRMEPEGFSGLPYTKGDENMHAAGGVVTSAADLASWLRANLNEGRVGGEQLLSAWAVGESHRPQAEQDNQFMSFKRTGYGLGWNTGSYEGDPFTHHFGGFSGFHAQISFMPEHDVGVAIMLNSGAGQLADLVSRYIYDSLNGKPDVEARYAEELERGAQRAAQSRERIAADRARRASRPQDLPYPLEAYAGVYENEQLGRLEFAVVDGKLEARMGRLWSPVEVYDNQKNMLRVELTGGGEVVPFIFREGEESAAALQFLRTEFRRLPF
jgi:CubicO group peptidase (beta-lactamase class C family)